MKINVNFNKTLIETLNFNLEIKATPEQEKKILECFAGADRSIFKTTDKIMNILNLTGSKKSGIISDVLKAIIDVYTRIKKADTERQIKNN